MSPRRFFIFLLIAGIALSVRWAVPAHARDKDEATALIKKKHKKRKKPKKEKKKKKKTAKAPKVKNARKDSLAKAKRDKKHDKQLRKVLSAKEKKKAKIAKASAAAHEPYDKCDSADVVRTSKDSLILPKYIRIYRSLGGICYIIHLQKMAELEETSDGFYSVHIKPDKDPRAPAAWQTYLYCPVGKPNGTVALLSPEGDTLQLASYQDERKNGIMSWVKKGKGVIYQEKYVGDEKVWEKKEE